jgi:D-arabinono-1,4-lactone oxidase
MKEYNGRPHWAKNFQSVDNAYLSSVYGNDLDEYNRVRNEVDPEGMFLGAWHRRTILPPKSDFPLLPLEEKEVIRRDRRTGGVEFVGEQARWFDGGVDVFEKAGSESGESFDYMAGAEAESSMLLESLSDELIVTEETYEKVTESRKREGTEEYMTGTNVFNKM